MHPHRYLLIVTGIAIVLLFIKLGAVSVFQVAEARNAQVPVEMMRTDNYIVPFFNGAIRTDKPPLHYYMMLAAYKIGGVNETASRFFSAFCGLFVIVAGFLFTRRNAGLKAAWWSSLVLLASLHTIFQFRLATPDPYFIACHTLSLFCFWEGYKTGKKSFYFLMYVCWGLALLAKGPVGLLLPAGTVLLFLIFNRKLNGQLLRSMQPFWGVLIISLVALPWFYLVHVKTNGAWSKEFFIQHMDRFSAPIGRHSGFFFLPVVFIIAGLFPFSFFMIRAIASSWRQRKQNSWLFFNGLAAAFIVVTYSFSATKLINYTTPAYPFLAIITGFYISRFISSGKDERKLMPEWMVLSLFSLALPMGVFYWINSEPTLYPLRSLSILLAIFPIAVLWGFRLYYQLRIYKAFLLVALVSITQTILFFTVLYPALDSCGSVAKQKKLLASGRPVVAFRSFNDAFVFYHQQPVVILPSAAAVSGYLKEHPESLVLERAWVPHLGDTLSQVSVVSMEKDLFSRQYSIIYQLKEKQ